MKYKIYLVASLLLGNALLGFSQSGGDKNGGIINDSIKTKGFAPAADPIPFQSQASIYKFGATEATATTQTEGGGSNNFNAIIPGRDFVETNAEVVKNSSSRSSVMRSNGPIYVGGDAGATTMAIYGSVFFDMDDANTKMTQKGADINLTGDLVVIEDKTAAATTTTRYLYEYEIPTPINNFINPFNPEGYNAGSYTNSGAINFIGKWNVQRIQKEDGNGNPILNDNTRFNSILNLPTVNVKKEGVATLYSGLDQNGVANPVAANNKDYDPYKMGFVSVASNMAVSIDTLDLTGGNRLSVDAISAGLEKVAVNNAISNSSTASATPDEYYKVNYGYLDINTQIGADNAAGGYGELNMRLYSFNPGQLVASDDDALFKNTSTSTVSNVKDLSGSYSAVFLRGITSPFNKLYDDYMLYNVLTKPEGSKMTGDKGTIVDPTSTINAGEAYFFALDVKDFQFDIITKNHDLGTGGSNSRARGGYNFSRYLRQYQFSPELNNKRFVFNSATRPYGYEEIKAKNFFNAKNENGSMVNMTTANNPQRFNTGSVEVWVKGGKKGYGDTKAVLLGNPYLVPINIGGILWNGRISDSDLETLRTNGSAAGADTGLFEPEFGGVKSSFKALHDATDQTYDPDDKLVIRSQYKPVISARVVGHEDKYYFNVNYEVVDIYAAAPTTAVPGDVRPHPQDYYLQPLQLFGVYAVGEGNFTFIPEMKVNGAKGYPFKVAYNELEKATPVKSFVDTQVQNEVDDNVVIIPDWFVIEASVKNDVLATDRTAVRFMTNANQSYDDTKDVIKNMKFFQEKDEIFEDDKTRALVRSTQNSMNMENSIYTTSMSGIPLKSNTTGYTSTKEIPLYYVPTKDGGDTSLHFSGVSGFKDIKKAWLVDRYENVKEQLTEGLVYNFRSQSNSTETANRFLLVFDQDGNSDDPNLPKANISIYYSNSTLYINGINQLDAGSIVQIFDVQGRTMGTTTISEGDASIGTKEYPKPLGLGTFIVKIIGKRNFNAKFVNTQNI